MTISYVGLGALIAIVQILLSARAMPCGGAKASPAVAPLWPSISPVLKRAIVPRGNCTAAQVPENAR